MPAGHAVPESGLRRDQRAPSRYRHTVAFDSTSQPARRPAGDLLAGCDRQQIEAITTTAAPLCVLAAAGSGKTRVLTRRIAWRVEEGSATAARVLAVTFTRKAAADLRSRLFELGLPEPVTAGTFHSIALAELRRLAADRFERPPVVLGSKVSVLGDVIDARAAAAAGRRSSRRRPNAGWSRPSRAVGELAQDLEWAKARCLQPADLGRAFRDTERRSSWSPDDVAEIWELYENEKRRRGVLDFEDLLTRCRDEIVRDPDFAASARWRFRHVFVDEYQDVNAAQQRLLNAWLGPSDDLCAVGDPHQAIYAWNGSNPRAIADFCADFPGATVIELSTNYRSTREVLTIAGAVLGARETARAGGPCPDGPLPTVTCYDDEATEASGIAARARIAKRPGRAWSQIAVLVRTNAQLPIIQTALEAAGIPCRVASAAAFLRSPWVTAALAQAAATPDAIGLATWASDLGAGEPERGGLSEGEIDPDGFDVAKDLEALRQLAIEYLGSDGGGTGRGFGQWVHATLRRDDEPSRRDAVELTTFHRAKGLEWAVVFLAGLEDGLVPISHATDSEAHAEERRLLYVACTRAAEELHCSWAAERGFVAGKPRLRRAPSPWLAAIQAAHRDLVAAQWASAGVVRKGLADSRKALGLV